MRGQMELEGFGMMCFGGSLTGQAAGDLVFGVAVASSAC